MGASDPASDPSHDYYRVSSGESGTYGDVNAGEVLLTGGVLTFGNLVEGGVHAQFFANLLAIEGNGLVNAANLTVGGFDTPRAVVTGGTINVIHDLRLFGAAYPDGVGSYVPTNSTGSDPFAPPWDSLGLVFKDPLATSFPGYLAIGSFEGYPVPNSHLLVGGDAFIGTNHDGGLLYVLGATNSADIAGNMIVAQDGSGDVYVFDNAKLTVVHDLSIAVDDPGADGSVALSKGALFVGGALNIGGREDFAVAPSRSSVHTPMVTVRDGSTVEVDGKVFVQSEARLTVSGQDTDMTVHGKFTIDRSTSVEGDFRGLVVVSDHARLEITLPDAVDYEHLDPSLYALVNRGKIEISEGAIVQVSSYRNESGGEIDDNFGIGKLIVLRKSDFLAPVKADFLSLGLTVVESSGSYEGGGTLNNITNDGLITAALDKTLAITGAMKGTGLLKIDQFVDANNITHKGTLDLSRATGPSIASFEDNGNLILGATDLHITGTFTNLFGGSGNSFNPHANVTGTGHIIGDGASLSVTGADVTSDASGPTLHLHSIGGGLESATFTLTNNGTGATVTAALQTLHLDGGFSGLAAGNVTLAAGANQTYTVTFNPSAGVLDGDTITIVSDFDNIAPITIGLTEAAAPPVNPPTVHWSASVDVGPHPAGWLPAGIGDFNGDATSDLAWFNASSGDVDIWKLANGHWSASSDVGPHPAGYQPAGFGDFNHDGTSDILWFNASTRDVDLWKIANGQWAGSVDIGTHPAGYLPALTGDFNHDGTSDVFWYNATSRDAEIWLIQNGQWAGSVDIGTHPAGYQPSLTGDFNGDGTSDVLWYNPTTRDTDIWLLSNGHWAGSTTIGVHPAGYQILGSGDFNQDGTSDVVWYNPTNNDIDVWLVNNGHWAGSVGLGSHPAGSVAVGVGDFDHNNVSDIMWRDTASGHIENWLLAYS